MRVDWNQELPDWVGQVSIWIAGLLAVLMILTALSCTPALVRQNGTAANLYEIANTDEIAGCEIPNAHPRKLKPGAPAWCQKCANSLDRLLTATDLARSASARPGKAPWQTERLAGARQAVERDCQIRRE